MNEVSLKGDYYIIGRTGKSLLQISVSIVHLVDRHAVADGFALGVLESEDFLGADEDLFYKLIGNDLETVIVAENEVAGIYYSIVRQMTADVNRNIDLDDAPTAVEIWVSFPG